MDNPKNNSIVIIGNKETDWALYILTLEEYRRPGINLEVVVRAEDAINGRNPCIVIIRQKYNHNRAYAAMENIGSITEVLNRKGYTGLVLVCYDQWCDNEIEYACAQNGLPRENILTKVGFFSGPGSTKRNADQFYGQLERILTSLIERQNTYEPAAQPKDLVHS